MLLDHRTVKEPSEHRVPNRPLALAFISGFELNSSYTNGSARNFSLSSNSTACAPSHFESARISVIVFTV